MAYLRALPWCLALCLSACSDDGSGAGLGDTSADSSSGDQSSPGNPSVPPMVTSVGTDCPDGCSDVTTNITISSGVTGDVDSGSFDTGSFDSGDATTTGRVPDGEPCITHAECQSGYCLSYSDAPVDPNAICEPAPEGGNTRVTATVRSLTTQNIASGATVDIISALNAATDPVGATSLLGAVADGAGLVDGVTMDPLSAQIGVVARATTANFALSATGVAAPNDDGSYPPGNAVHDLWVIAQADVDYFNDALATDVDAAPFLPIGQEGGMVGIVRDETGTPVEGATVFSAAFESDAVVRYVGAAGANAEATDALGLFVVLNPALAEEFVVQTDASENGFTAGSAAGVVFIVGVIATP